MAIDWTDYFHPLSDLSAYLASVDGTKEGVTNAVGDIFAFNNPQMLHEFYANVIDTLARLHAVEQHIREGVLQSPDLRHEVLLTLINIVESQTPLWGSLFDVFIGDERAVKELERFLNRVF